MDHEILWWVGFNIFVGIMLLLDLGVFHRRARTIEVRESLVWSAVWIALALLFNLMIYIWMGAGPALEFFTGYLIERSLSIDNIFIFLLIFSYFGVPSDYHYKVLFWGILGALVMRAAAIWGGIVLIQRFHWALYAFALLLIVSGIRMAMEKGKEIHPERNPVLRLARRLFPVTEGYEGDRFFVRRAGRYFATPLFLVILVVETSDLVFALDSIPAILAITLDPFIVYTSNVFAILGLRALYFAMAGLMRLFECLHYGLAGILVFVGVKMLLAEFYPIPVWMALGSIAAILAISVLASLVALCGRKEEMNPADPPEDAGGEGEKKG